MYRKRPRLAAAISVAALGLATVAVQVLPSRSTFAQSTAVPGVPYSLFGSGAVSAAVWSGSPVSTGVRLSVSQASVVSAVRWWKDAGDTGAHVVSVWGGDGRVLAQQVASGESASGWQTVTLASPVRLASGASFVASVSHPAGTYVSSYDAWDAVAASGPLVPSRNSAGGSGVYAYGSTALFPTSTYRASNYFVDVVAQLDTAPPPPGSPVTTTTTTPPTVTTAAPTTVAPTTTIAAGSGPSAGCLARIDAPTMSDIFGNLPSAGGTIDWQQKSLAKLQWMSPKSGAIVLRVVYQADAPVTRRFYFGGAQMLQTLPATGAGYGSWTKYVNLASSEWMLSDAQTSGAMRLAYVEYCTYPYTGSTTPTTPVTTTPATTTPATTTTTVAGATTTKPPVTTTTVAPVTTTSPPVVAPAGGRQIPRSGANLFSASSVSTDLCSTAGWSLVYGATYDGAVTRGSCGSIALPTAVTCAMSSTDITATQNTAELNSSGLCPYAGGPPKWVAGSLAQSAPITVNPGISGAIYTFAGYMRTDVEPRGTVTLIAQGFRPGSATAVALDSDVFGNSRVGAWEEFALQVKVPSGVTQVSLSVNRYAPDSSIAGGRVAKIWIDDLYFGAGVGYEQPPSAKQAFNGSLVSVDAYGNFRRNGADFFPMCMATSGSRHTGPTGYQFYSSKGWNCMWAANVIGWQDAVTAGNTGVNAEFAPDGMCFQLDLNDAVLGPMNPATGAYTWSPDTVTRLQAAIRGINANYPNRMCSYILDAENGSDKLTRAQAVLSMVDATDREGNGGVRRHPIVANIGNPALARWYRTSTGTPLLDVIGTYTGWTGGMQTQDNIEGQTSPGGICQLSSGIGAQFRARAFRCLAQGSKGISFWADAWGYAGPVETESWWADSIYIAREIKAMMPLIRQPHWTNWKISYGTDPQVYIGTRELNGQGYIIASNDSFVSKTITMNVSSLPYRPTALLNYFTGATVASFNGTSVTFTLPPTGNAGSVGGGGGTLVARIS